MKEKTDLQLDQVEIKMFLEQSKFKTHQMGPNGFLKNKYVKKLFKNTK